MFRGSVIAEGLIQTAIEEAIAIEVDGNLRKTFTLESEYPIGYRGDSLGSNHLSNDLDIDNNAIS